MLSELSPHGLWFIASHRWPPTRPPVPLQTEHSPAVAVFGSSGPFAASGSPPRHHPTPPSSCVFPSQECNPEYSFGCKEKKNPGRLTSKPLARPSPGVAALRPHLLDGPSTLIPLATRSPVYTAHSRAPTASASIRARALSVSLPHPPCRTPHPRPLRLPGVRFPAPPLISPWASRLRASLVARHIHDGLLTALFGPLVAAALLCTSLSSPRSPTTTGSITPAPDDDGLPPGWAIEPPLSTAPGACPTRSPGKCRHSRSCVRGCAPADGAAGPVERRGGVILGLRLPCPLPHPPAVRLVRLPMRRALVLFIYISLSLCLSLCLPLITPSPRRVPHPLAPYPHPHTDAAPRAPPLRARLRAPPPLPRLPPTPMHALRRRRSSVLRMRLGGPTRRRALHLDASPVTRRIRRLRLLRPHPHPHQHPPPRDPSRASGTSRAKVTLAAQAWAPGPGIHGGTHTLTTGELAGGRIRALRVRLHGLVSAPLPALELHAERAFAVRSALTCSSVTWARSASAVAVAAAAALLVLLRDVRLRTFLHVPA
ncbi:hypothetical protein B0H11DRAFT_2216190 [Mycena galericulata]|nr:hypothetical protein B0H11DRAFT_2216190 [Mycena galericulata]